MDLNTNIENPNVLFILIDDIGWKNISCQVSEFYETPNIDSIAMEEIQVPHAYSSCLVCSPTGVSIMTGKYPPCIGITQGIGGNNGTKSSNIASN